MTNNEVLKKLRVALSLKDTDIIDILKLADFDISKGALGDLFRSEDHPNFVEAGDQILRNFLNGLVIYKRGPEMKREGSTTKKPNNTFNSDKKPVPVFAKRKGQVNESKSGQRSKDILSKSEEKKGLFEKDYFAKKR